MGGLHILRQTVTACVWVVGFGPMATDSCQIQLAVCAKCCLHARGQPLWGMLSAMKAVTEAVSIADLGSA